MNTLHRRAPGHNSQATRDRVCTLTDPQVRQDADLWSTSLVFRAGHRMRAQVTSSNFPRWDRNLHTGEPEQSATISADR